MCKCNDGVTVQTFKLIWYSENGRLLTVESFILQYLLFLYSLVLLPFTPHSLNTLRDQYLITTFCALSFCTGLLSLGIPAFHFVVYYYIKYSVLFDNAIAVLPDTNGPLFADSLERAHFMQ